MKHSNGFAEACARDRGRSEGSGENIFPSPASRVTPPLSSSILPALRATAASDLPGIGYYYGAHDQAPLFTADDELFFTHGARSRDSFRRRITVWQGGTRPIKAKVQNFSSKSQG